MSRIRWAGALAVIAAAVAVTAWSGFNSDVAYVFGGLETAGRGGVSVWDVFVARPLFYRLPIAALDAVRTLFVPDPHTTGAQIVIRVETDLLILAVAIVLFIGLRQFAGTRPAAATALAAGLALAVAPPWHFLQPDWLAVLAAVLAVGAGLLTRRPWLGGLFGGAAAAMVVAAKAATFPVALLALLMIALADRRRAAWATAWTIALAVLWTVSARHLRPWEWIWLNDQSSLLANAPIHRGVTRGNVHALLLAIGNVAVLSPLVAVAPAAAAVLVRARAAGRPRLIAAGVAVIAAGLSVASGYGQGEFYMYHFAPVPVLAAAACALAFALQPGARLPLAVTTLVFTAASIVLTRQPPAWRAAHATPVIAAYVLAALVAVGCCVLVKREVGWLTGAVALSAAVVVASLPGAPYSFSTFDHTIPNRPLGTDRYAALRGRIGPDTPVMYLTFGALNYSIGNPTTCRYPSPQWVQRGNHASRVRAFPSYADNLRCLDDEHTARYVLIQEPWFSAPTADPAVTSLIGSRFDCSAGFRYLDLTVCPAR